MANQFKIEGLDLVVKKLKSLPEKMQRKGLQDAVRKGANLVKKDAQRRARRFDRPQTPQAVFKEIVTRVDNKAGNKVGGVVMHVGVRGGARRYKNNKHNRKLNRVGARYEGPGNVFYWRFLEFGTSKMRAQPFMRPALASNVGAVTDLIVAALRVELDKLTR